MWSKITSFFIWPYEVEAQVDKFKESEETSSSKQSNVATKVDQELYSAVLQSFLHCGSG